MFESDPHNPVVADDNLDEIFLPLSPYLGAPADLQAPLTEDIRADVAIIGGGWTGLSAALALRQQGAHVVLLDQAFCGYGASGRSGGHLVGPGKESRRFFARGGTEAGREYARYITRIVDIAAQQIKDLGIDCDYIASGNLYGATHTAMLEPLRAYTKAASDAGFEMHFLDAPACRERGIPAAWIGGAFIPAGGSLHPGKYVGGMRRAALAAGVAVYEGTTVTRIDEGRPAVLHSATGGSVAADAVIVAAGAFTPATLGRFDSSMAAFRIGAFETAPLDGAQIEALGWPGREGLISMHNVIEAYRVTAHNTIVSNTKRIFVEYGNRLTTTYQGRIFEPMVAAFRERFPALRELPIANCWGGWCALTPDMLPRVGVTGRDWNIYFGFGFNGHGVAPSAAIGQALAKAIQGIDDPNWTFLTSRRQWRWPPEPLRWLGASSYIGWMQWQDDRLDRAIRNGQTSHSEF